MAVSKNKLISTVVVFVSIDEDGNEGVIGQKMDGVWMPFVCADEARIKQFFPSAEAIAKEFNIKYRILKFSVREDVTDVYDYLKD